VNSTIHGWYGYPIQNTVVIGVVWEIVWKVLVASHRALYSEKGHLVGGFNPSEKICESTT